MRRAVKIYGLWVIGLLTFFTSCRSDIVYSRFVPISSGEWSVDSVVQFDYTISDATADYTLLVYVRHTERYPYQNMWLFMDDGTRRDTIEFYLADDRGQWLSNKHHGVMEMSVLFEPSKHYPDTGCYHMTIQHGMRDSLLRGVMDIGLEIRHNGTE